MKKIRSAILAFLLLTSIPPRIIFAATTDDLDISKTPSVTFWGLGGEQFIGSGQGLIPFGGNGVNSIFYGAVEAAGSFKESNGYSAGAAAGYRKIINNSVILGGYLFSDYNRSPAGHDFLVANPGFEVLGNIWDFRVNGYIPTTCRHWLGREELAENIGITQFEEASGHLRYDHLFQWYEEAGPGVDAEVGRLIPIPKMHGLRAYVGGYHYFMDKTAEITGVESRIVYPMTKYVSLEARDSYDSVRKNVFMSGLRITFGGYNNEDKDSLGISGRLADPIEHNFGNFASANSTAVGKAYTDKGEEQLPGSFWYYDNASLSPISSVSIGDGSYEHPFTAIDSRSYTLMTAPGPYSQNVKMYVDTGISPYDLSGMTDNRLPLPSGYSIYGRTAHFTLAAAGSQRAELDGGITAFGENNINDIQLKSQNNGFKNFGVLYLNGASNVNINDVNITVSENSTDVYGINAVNSSAIINNSVVTVSSTAERKQSIGIGLQNSTLFVGSNNSIKASLTSAGDGSNAGGIAGDGVVKIVGNNNQTIADTFGDESHAIGILDAGTLTISGSNNHIAANAAGFDSRAGGIVDVGTAIISGNKNQITGNATGLEGKALGIGEIGILDSDTAELSGGNEQITISGNKNQIIGKSAESNSIGIVNFDGELAISGSHNQIIADSASHVAGHECNAGGIVNFGNATVAISGNTNQIAVHSAYNAYGITYLEPLTAAPALSIKNTRFNILATGGGTAAGIDLGTQTDASKIILQNNRFNVATDGVGSNAYGIYLQNAITPDANGNIAANIFKIINADMPQNAWGVYANSNWGGAAAWIREHNIWINPTSATPQQQVYTDGVGFVK
jgi:hypothetical protein